MYPPHLRGHMSARMEDERMFRRRGSMDSLDGLSDDDMMPRLLRNPGPPRRLLQRAPGARGTAAARLSRGSASGPPSRELIVQLTDMGFAWSHAVAALEANGSSVERSADWLLSGAASGIPETGDPAAAGGGEGVPEPEPEPEVDEEAKAKEEAEKKAKEEAEAKKAKEEAEAAAVRCQAPLILLAPADSASPC